MLIQNCVYSCACRRYLHWYSCHNSGADAFGARPTVVHSVIVDGMAADRAMQPTPTPIEGVIVQYPSPEVLIGLGLGCRLLILGFPEFPSHMSEMPLGRILDVSQMPSLP